MSRHQDTIWERQLPAPRERRAPLTREDIAAAAIALVDREGPDALTMRRVAAEAGIPTMTLYSYVRDKQELLDLGANEMCAAMVVPDGELPTDWRAALTEIAWRTYRFFLGHPWILAFMDHPDPIAGPNIIKHMEQTLAAVSTLPLDPELRRAVPHIVDHYVFGTAMQVIDQRHQQDIRQRTPRERQRLEQGMAFLDRMVASGAYPHLAAEMKQRPGYPTFGEPDVDVDARFELGLRWLLDGIDGELRRSRRS